MKIANIPTIIICLFLLLSSYSYLFSSATISGLKELGLPDFLRLELATLKILAALVLITNWGPSFLKEWAYAGVTFFLITAFVAHIVHRDSIFLSLILVLLLSLNSYSYYLYKLNN